MHLTACGALHKAPHAGVQLQYTLTAQLAAASHNCACCTAAALSKAGTADSLTGPWARCIAIIARHGTGPTAVLRLCPASVVAGTKALQTAIP